MMFVYILFWGIVQVAAQINTEKDTLPQAAKQAKVIKSIDREMERNVAIFKRKKHELDSLLPLIKKKLTKRQQRQLRKAIKEIERSLPAATGIPDTIILADTIFPNAQIIDTNIDITPTFEKPKRKWLFFNQKN